MHSFRLEADNYIDEIETRDRTIEGLRQTIARLLRRDDQARRSFARELHDSAGQILCLLSMNLASMTGEAEKCSSQMSRTVSESAALVADLIRQIRTTSYLLHPPLLDEMGLRSALGCYVEGFAQRSGMEITLNIESDVPRLAPELEMSIFRIVQECLTNVYRHSGSRTAAISLARSRGQLKIAVEDQGHGMASNEEHGRSAHVFAEGVGIRGMTERALEFGGRFEIRSSASGTQAITTLPLPKQALTTFPLEEQSANYCKA